MLAIVVSAVLAGCRTSACAEIDAEGAGTARPRRTGVAVGPSGPVRRVPETPESEQREKEPAQDSSQDSGKRPERPDFKLSGWIPRWRKKEGVASVLEHLSLFASVSPFAYRAGNDGRVRDTLKAKRAPWPELQRRARQNAVRIIPTFVWAEPATMARSLARADWRTRHIREIVDAVVQNGFDGADIDYETKSPAFRDAFSAFVVGLSRELHKGGRLLSCTVEPRTADQPPSAWRGVRAAAWANDYAVMAKACDEIRVMAYDQWRVGHGSRWRSRSPEPQVSHADIDWVDRVVAYTRRVVPAHKLLLGIPTYGWEFSVQGRRGDWRIQRLKALSFVDFSSRQQSAGMAQMPARRHQGGELVMDITRNARRRLLLMPDAQAVGHRIRLAKRHGLGGVVLFKLDGLADPALWKVLRQHLLHKSEKAIGSTELEARGER